jgi:hypothetical protein
MIALRFASKIESPVIGKAKSLDMLEKPGLPVA